MKQFVCYGPFVFACVEQVKFFRTIFVFYLYSVMLGHVAFRAVFKTYRTCQASKILHGNISNNSKQSTW